MPTTNRRENTQNAAATTTGKKAGKAGGSTMMDDAPLFAGLDDFVLIQVERKKGEKPKTVPPREKPEKRQAGPTTSGVAPLPGKKAPKTQQKGRQPPDPNSLLLSVTELCTLLKISRATLIRMDKAGKLPGRIKLGGSVRFHRETIDAWLKDLLTPTTT